MASESSDKEAKELIEPTLFRLTKGLPNRELKIIVKQAAECEQALQQEIKLLEAALHNNNDDESATSSTEDKEAVNLMLASEFTPPDNCFTVSALLGRLREPMATPLAPNTTIVRPPLAKKLKRSNTPTPQETQTKLFKSLLELNSYPAYTRVHEEPSSLLALWKRISSHKSAVVFRKPVNPKEAPGYAERIVFPIDLSLIRKMITARIITSFRDLHERIGMICHNCVKFNGR